MSKTGHQSSRSVSSKLEVPLSLGTKQPALVRVGIRCRAKPADVATFLNRGRRAFQAIAPNGVCCEDPQLRASKEATPRLNGRRDSEHSHCSAAAKSSGTERARISGRIAACLKPSHVIGVAAINLSLDRDIIRDPDVRSETGFVKVTPASSIPKHSSARKNRVWEAFPLPKTG